MEKENKLLMQAEELAALASSLAICISQKYSFCDAKTIRQFLSCVVSNLCLIEHQTLSLKDFNMKK